MKKATYNTSGRRRLLEFLSENPDRQFSVEELCVSLNGDAETGRSSLYRRLDALCKSDAVKRFRSEERGCSLYQYTGEHCSCGSHFHEKCIRCGTLHHLDCDDSVRFARHLLHTHGFAVDQGRSILYGVCADCRAKEV